MKSIRSRKIIHATITLPGSKSITHRALIAASLASGKSIIRDALMCDDTIITMEALKELGAKIEKRGRKLEVVGIGGPPVNYGPGIKLFMGESGTSLRLLLGMVSSGRGDFLFEGSAGLCRRPVDQLTGALEKLGAHIEYNRKYGYPPLAVKASGLKGGKIEVSDLESSQYISSLLMCAPFSTQDLEIIIRGELVSAPYVDMTVDVMASFGVYVKRDGYGTFIVKSGQSYRARNFSVEGDASAAAFFWAAAAVTGGQVTTKGLGLDDTMQGDIRFLEILEDMGCKVDRARNQVTVSGQALQSVEVDLGCYPDLAPPLAAVAVFTKGKTIIHNVAHLRLKESDRLKAIAREWGKLGASVEQHPDGLTIEGGKKLTGATVDPHNDHRIAMALGVIGLRVPGIQIRGEECVAKSFPEFWGLWDSL